MELLAGFKEFNDRQEKLIGIELAQIHLYKLFLSSSSNFSR